jgi:hypothetical protein
MVAQFNGRQAIRVGGPYRRTTNASTLTHPPPTTRMVIRWVAIEAHVRW